MSDPTEGARRKMVEEINRNPDGRAELALKHGPVWDTDELQRDFTVRSFMAPFVMAMRKADGKVGSLMFQDYPRFYYGFRED